MRSVLSTEDPDLKKYDLFVDLDQLESRKTGFILGGKKRVIRPVGTLEWFKIANAFSRLRSLVNQDKITAEELFNAYWEIFSLICDPFTKEDLQGMSHQQCGALYQAIEDHITGRFRVSAEKKSPLTQ